MGVAVAALAAGCGGDHAPAPTVERDALRVDVVEVTAAPRPSVVESGGLVQARTTAAITSHIMATVREVRVVPGDTVRAGQVLVVLDDRDIAAQARSAEAAAGAASDAVVAATAERAAADAALTLARASHGRLAALAARKSATAQELDEATAALRAAEHRLAASDARVAQARSALGGARAAGEAARVTAGYGRIVAPFAGVVTEKLVEPGNMAMPGTPLLRMEEQGAARLDVRVDASRVAAVESGQTVSVRIDADEPISLDGRVTEVSRAMDADSRAYLVRIALPVDARVRTGMFGRAQFAGPSSASRVVPASAVRRQGQVASVFVAEGGVARLRLVVAGRPAADGIEIVGGLADGDRVVIAPPQTLVDGSPIRTRSE
ncbi:MAG: efflux RND transporter periplasmic adaptor subunit [Acidobacteria bacterium]|nr:efflux RND transporter periplasmic adaptor subunit [Acidobacteriota bacterium]